VSTYGAAVIIEDDRGRVLLLKRSPTMSWKPGRWNLPAGHVEPGELAAEAAVREAYEEAGLRVAKVMPVVRVHFAPFVVDVYHSVDWTGRVRLNAESIAFKWVPVGDACRDDLLRTHRDALRWFADRY
jgi:8-oxo-dGTP pyrophosphatase MutT (NUDIX family)